MSGIHTHVSPYKLTRASTEVINSFNLCSLKTMWIVVQAYSAAASMDFIIPLYISQLNTLNSQMAELDSPLIHRVTVLS